MARHVGVVACSPPGAALCFEILSGGASSLPSESGRRVYSHTLSSSPMVTINSSAVEGRAEGRHRKLQELVTGSPWQQRTRFCG